MSNDPPPHLLPVELAMWSRYYMHDNATIGGRYLNNGNVNALLTSISVARAKALGEIDDIARAKATPDVDVKVPLKIIGKERARVVTQKGKKARAFTPDRTVRFEADFALACSSAMPRKPWAGPVRMETTILIPHETKTGPCIGKPDIDNCLKAVMDSLKGRAYVDDCQVWRETTEKLWASEPLIRLRMWFDRE